MRSVKICTACGAKNGPREDDCTQCAESLPAEPELLEDEANIDNQFLDDVDVDVDDGAVNNEEPSAIESNEEDQSWLRPGLDDGDQNGKFDGAAPSVHSVSHTNGALDSAQLILESGCRVDIGNGVILGRSRLVSGATIAAETADRLGVSRIHAWVGPFGNSLAIVDLHSRNGTFINGNRLVAGQGACIESPSTARITLGKKFNIGICLQEGS